VENTALPHSMLLVCSSRLQQVRHNIVWGYWGLKGQARGAKRDHSDEIGGWKGECVNNLTPIGDATWYWNWRRCREATRLEAIFRFETPESQSLDCDFHNEDYLMYPQDRFLYWNFCLVSQPITCQCLFKLQNQVLHKVSVTQTISQVYIQTCIWFIAEQNYLQFCEQKLALVL